MAGHNGYFKTGDYVEISGEPDGIVEFSDEKVFGIRIFKNRKGTELTPFIRLYSNDPEHYKNSYWIKRISNGPSFEYKTADIVPMKLN